MSYSVALDCLQNLKGELYLNLVVKSNWGSLTEAAYLSQTLWGSLTEEGKILQHSWGMYTETASLRQLS